MIFKGFWDNMRFNSRKIIVLSLFLILFSLIALGSVNAYDIEGNDDFTAIISSSNDSMDDSSSLLENNCNSNENLYSSDSWEGFVSSDYDDEIFSSESGEESLDDSYEDIVSDSNSDGTDQDIIVEKTPLDQFLEDIENYSGGTIYITGNLIVNRTISLKKPMAIDGQNYSISSNGLCRIFNINSDVVLKNIVFKNAVSTNGGAIYSSAKLSLASCQFLNNKASSNGGVIYSLGNLDINKCKFDKNSADGLGGAIYCAGELTVKNSNFTNNAALKSAGAIYIKNKLTLSNSYFSQNKASVSGGAIYTANKTATIKSCRFEKNSVSSKTSKVLGGAILASYNTVISNSIFNSNYCKYTKSLSLTYQSLGGAIAYTSGDHTLSSSSFDGNYVDNDGGAILAGRYVNKVTVDKSTFANNKANFEDGGAISSAAKTIQIKNSKFLNNFANEDGGAIDVYSLTGKTVNVKISSCDFKSNVAHKAAGAVYLGQKTNRVIENSNFNYNKATIGGCMYIEAGTTKINKCSFIGNSASKLTKNAIYNKNHQKIINAGGTIFNNGSSLQILSSRFDSNKAVYGGVIYNKGPLVLKNSKLNSNSASLGGAILTSLKSVKSSGNSFSKNKASSLGGAIYLNSGSMKLYSNTLKSNKASSLGGAIYLYSGTMNVYSSTLKSNKASTSGGALYLRSGKFYSKDSSYYFNNANANGGALLIHSGKVNLLSNIFNTNKAKSKGGAIYIKSAKGKIKSNAFVFSKAGKCKGVFSEKSISLANNWWGKIKKSPKKLKITNIKVKSWLVLKIKSSKSKLAKGKSSKIKVNLRYNNKNKKVSYIPKLKVTFSSKGGTFNANTKKLNKGVATVKFKKGTSKKTKVTGKVLGVRVSVSIR